MKEKKRLGRGLEAILGESVKEAARRVGYDDPYYFSRTFRAVFGVPPSALGARRTT